MSNYLLVACFILFLMSILLFAFIGRAFAAFQKKRHPDRKLKNNKIIEGSIFALMGLLIALTFSGARERFEIRRTLVINEANAIETTYFRLNLLSSRDRLEAQRDLKKYLTLRLSIYDKLPHIASALPEIKKSYELQHAIWNISLKNCEQQKTSAICIVLLPAINSMIDLANTRLETTQIHPPSVILMTLIGIALLSAALSGYSSRNKSIFHTLHFIIYAVIIAFTIFIIIGLEYPNTNLIKANYFNEVLVHLGERLS